MSIMPEVSILGRLDAAELKGVQAEVESLPAELWRTHYSEYHTGGWKTVSLLNPSGVASEGLIHDGGALPTTILDRLPNVRRCLEVFGFRYNFARAAKLEPGAMLWEHVDYRELRPVGRLRLHIPIVTNDHAFMVIRGMRFHMGAGLLWKLDPRSPHGVANFGDSARIHLILDCYVDGRIGKLLEQERLVDELMTDLPAATADQMAQQDHEFGRTLVDDDIVAAERYLLSRYFSHSFAPGALYERLVDLCKKHREHARGELWKSRAKLFLGGSVDR